MPTKLLESSIKVRIVSTKLLLNRVSTAESPTKLLPANLSAVTDPAGQGKMSSTHASAASEVDDDVTAVKLTSMH